MLTHGGIIPVKIKGLQGGLSRVSTVNKGKYSYNLPKQRLIKLTLILRHATIPLEATGKLPGECLLLPELLLKKNAIFCPDRTETAGHFL
jgi:hypothetical protein